MADISQIQIPVSGTNTTYDIAARKVTTGTYNIAVPSVSDNNQTLATQSYVDNKLTNSVNYLGTFTTLAELTATGTIGKKVTKVGDWARMASTTTFSIYDSANGAATTVHVGDIVIATSTTITATTTGSSWDVVHTENDTNTWRGIQNNLTSTSTSDSLSAYQGKLLNDNKQDKITFNSTYNASSNKAATMTDITNAIGTAISGSY